MCLGRTFLRVEFVARIEILRLWILEFGEYNTYSTRYRYCIQVLYDIHSTADSIDIDDDDFCHVVQVEPLHNTAETSIIVYFAFSVRNENHVWQKFNKKNHTQERTPSSICDVAGDPSPQHAFCVTPWRHWLLQPSVTCCNDMIQCLRARILCCLPKDNMLARHDMCLRAEIYLCTEGLAFEFCSLFPSTKCLAVRRG